MSNERRVIEQQLAEADRLEEAGRIREALDCLGIALSLEETPYLFFRYGSLAFELKEWEKANQAFLSSLSLAPDNSLAYRCLGIINRKVERFEVAINYFEKSLEIEESAATYTLLGVSQIDLRMIEAAKLSFCKAININPNYEEAYYNLAMIYKWDNSEKAISLLQKSLELDPDYALARSELGWLLNTSGRLSEAEFHLRKSIELDESDGWAYVYLGNALWKQKKNPDAEQMFMKAVEVYPQDSFTHWCLAIFYEYNGRLQEADFFYEKATQLDPDDPEANFRFGLFLKELGENAKAKTHVQRVLASDPKNYEAELVLAELEEIDEVEAESKIN